MAVPRLSPIGAQQAVLPRQVETEIAVGLVRMNGMVDPVHVQGDDYPAQDPGQAEQNAHVTVVEHRGSVQQPLEDQHRDGGRSEHGNHGELSPHREQDLDGVKAQPRGDIELQVGMVHAMQAPEDGDRMEQHMLQIDRQIEGQQRNRQGEREGQVE